MSSSQQFGGKSHRIHVPMLFRKHAETDFPPTQKRKWLEDGIAQPMGRPRNSDEDSLPVGSQLSPHLVTGTVQRAITCFVAGLITLSLLTTDSAFGGLISSSTSIEVSAATSPTGDVVSDTIPANANLVRVAAGQTTTGRSANSQGVAIFHSQTAGTADFRLNASSGGTQGYTNVGGHSVYQFETNTNVELIVESANRILLDERNPSYFGVANAVLQVTTEGGGVILDARPAFDSRETYSVLLDPGVYELHMDAVRFGVLGSAEFNKTLDTLFNWGLNTLPGVLVDVPILPIFIDPEFFDFDVITDATIRYFDPDFATGYDYSTSEVPFASVLIPDILPGGDNQFELLVGSDRYQLNAGQEFDFTSIYQGGVRDFSIRGINLSEELDPADPTAFVTGLSFVEGDQLSSFRMTPITSTTSPVPEPSSLAMFGVGTIGMCFYLRRRRRTETKEGPWRRATASSHTPSP